MIIVGELKTNLVDLIPSASGIYRDCREIIWGLVEHIKVNSDGKELNNYISNDDLINIQSNFHENIMKEEGYGNLPICFGKRRKPRRLDENVTEASNPKSKRAKLLTSKSYVQKQKKSDKYKWGNLHHNSRKIIHSLPLPPYCKRRGNARPQEDNVYLCPYLHDASDNNLYLVRVVGVGPSTTTTATTTTTTITTTTITTITNA